MDRRYSRRLAGLAALAVAAAGCGSSPTKAATGTTVTPAAGGAASTAAIVESTSLGKVLANTGGRTLYLLTGDTVGHQSCTGGCLSIWPPVIVQGAVKAAGGVSAKLSTTKTSSGEQLVVDGNPVFLYGADSGAGQTNGQGISSFGGMWYALGPSGHAVTGKPASSTTTSSGYGSGY